MSENLNKMALQEILAVDNDPGSLQLLEKILDKSGYDVRLAINGTVALRSVVIKPPDLILLDVKMPDMDGYEVCRRLKSDEKSHDIPVIFISGLSDTTQRVLGFNVGGVDYITKPFEPEEVLARVRIHLQLRELTEKLEQKVTERTEQLLNANSTLQQEMEERKKAEKNVRESESLLKVLNKNLENTIQELAAANKELESFSYSVAHDLRNPLKVISSFTDILIEDYAERLDEDGKELLKKIKNSTGRMNTIICDILALSKISRQEIEIADLDLSEMAHSAINELSAANPDRKVDVKIQEGVRARADARLLHVTLANLLGNAWKYTEKVEHPEIEFGSFEKGGQRIFYVKDNGDGFDMCQAGKLFAPFQRLHSEKEFKGIGVGLAIVERAVSRHGGKVWAQGEVGKGAIFLFTLGE